jgi:hypothetical protein
VSARITQAIATQIEAAMPMRDGPASAARLCDRRELSVEVAKTVFEMRAVDRRAHGTERGQGFTLGAELPIEGSAAGMIRTAGEPHFIKKVLQKHRQQLG